MDNFAIIALNAARLGLAILREPKTPELVDKLVDSVHELARQVNGKLQAEGDKLHLYVTACSDHCAWCCHQEVGASVPEVVRVARHLRETRTPDEITALKAKLHEVADRTNAMTVDDWITARVACPLLDAQAGSCTIYEARPSACRGYNSLDVAQCRRKYDTGSADVRANDVQRRSMLAGGIGLITACRLAGLEWHVVGLTAGLALALSIEDVEGRWLRGERQFEAARTSRITESPYLAEIEGAMNMVPREELPTSVPRARVDEETERRERNRRKRQRKGR
jgi:Fe-S-cluster containining protein